MKWIPVLALAMLSAGPLQAQTQQRPDPLRIVAVNVTAAADDARAGSAVLPGDVLEYRLLFTNVTGGIVRNVVFEDPIPAGLVYEARTAGADRQDVRVEFSIDGGQTFQATPMIEVVEDGRRVERPAPPERYTHVRWTITGSVLPDATVTALFRARVDTQKRP